MRKFILLPILFICYFSFAQNEIKVYPSSWWVGMRNPHVQLMFHGNNIGRASYKLEYPGVKLDSSFKLINPNYLFLDLTISPDAKPGIIKINFNGGQHILNFELEKPAPGKGTIIRTRHSVVRFYLPHYAGPLQQRRS